MWSMRYQRASALALLLTLAVTAPAAQSGPLERGAFTLYKFQQAIGRETYEVAADGGAYVVTTSFEFTDRGTKVPLAATLRMKADFTPERVEGATGIDAETTRRVARELAAAPTAAVYARIGTCTQEFGTLASWLVDVVNVLTGNLDRPGGAMFTKAATSTAGGSGKGRGVKFGRRQTRVRELPEYFGEFPVVAFAEEIETPLGLIRTLRFRRQEPDGTLTEVWLDVDRNLLPAKLYSVDRKGNVLDQVIREARLE